MKKIIHLSVLLFILVGSASADMVSINPRPRGESMGGAGLATIGDKDSAIMNPASLADISETKTQGFPILLEVPFNIPLFTKALDYDAIRDDSSKTQDEKREALEDLLQDAATAAQGMRVNLYPSFTTKNLHFGLMIDATLDPRLRVGGATSDQVIEFGGSNATAGAYIGGGYGFLEDQLQVGLTLKPLYRMSVVQQDDATMLDVATGFNQDGSVADQILGEDKLKQRGYGIGADIGVKYYLPIIQEFKPTVGLTYQDIGNTRFVSDHKLPADIPQSISLGAAIHPNWKFLRNTFALDFRNITAESDFLNKLHIGAETVLWDLLAIRLGLSQAYFTGGLGVITRFFEADVYVTSREAGRFAHIQDITVAGVRLSGSF